MSAIPFQVPAHTQSISLAQARVDLPPEEFRQRLRSHFQTHPEVTLQRVARELGVTRQCVSQLVGKLNRPNCASPLFMRLAPKTQQAKQKLPELEALVAAGLSAERAATQLQISLPAAIKLGFRSKQCRPPHGSPKRTGCNCWRCRRAGGLVAPRTNSLRRAQVLDMLAWNDPYTGKRLTQAAIGNLTGVTQAAVSRISKLEGC